MKKLNKKIWIPSAAVLVLLVVAIILLLTRCGSCVDGHSWSEWTELTEATCSVEGEKIHTCTVCGKVEIVDSETTEHDYRTVWDSGETRHWQECVDCGAKCNAEYHTPGEWEIVTEPACETVGTKKRACSVCEKEEIETLEATGHTYTESWSINSIKHFHKCTTCGTKVKTEVHAYDKWTTEGSRKWSNCKTCGYKCVQEVTKAQSITLSGGKSLTVGGTLQLTATAGSSRLTSRNATWSSSDKSVATVDSNGKVTGRKLGSADITVTSGEGAKKTVTVWVTETAIDGKLTDGFYSSTGAFRWLQTEGNVGEKITLYLGRDGLYIADKVTDAKVKENGDKSHVESFLTLSDLFSTSDSIGFRFYPNGYSATGSICRVYQYNYQGESKSYHWSELKGSKMPDVSASVVYTSEGYDIEAFVPWEAFGLTEAPESVYYLSAVTAVYENGQKWRYGTYDVDVKAYSEKDLYDLNNYIQYDDLGFVYKEVNCNVDEIVMGNNFLTGDGYYVTEFDLNKLNEINPLNGVSFSGTAAKYIKEISDGTYQIKIPASKVSSFAIAQKTNILDVRSFGKNFTLRIFDGVLVDDLTINYRDASVAPVLYGQSNTLDMKEFSTVTSMATDLNYEWTLSCNGEDVTNFDIDSKYTFGQFGSYVLTANIDTDGYEGAASMTIYVMNPEVYVGYKNGTTENTGSASDIVAGTYKLNQTPYADSFTAVDNSSVTYTKGIAGDSRGAVVTNHKNGPYTVINDYAFGKEDFTISYWFNVPVEMDVDGGGKTFMFGNMNPDGTDGFAVSLKSNSLRVKLLSNMMSPEISYEKDQWYNVTFIREGGTVKLYFDGSLLANYSISADCDFGTGDLAFGAHLGWQYSYKDASMYFDDVQVYGSVLTEEQIQAIAQINMIPAGEVKPAVAVDYTDGIIQNSGTDSSVAANSYKLDKMSNATEFVSVNNADVTYVTGVNGETNGAISTNHYNGTYTVVTGYEFGTDDWTVSVWFKIPGSTDVSTKNGTYLFGTTHPDGSDGFSVCYREESGTSKLRFKLLSNSGDFIKVTATRDKWHKVALTREGTSVKLYLDGVQLKSYTVSASATFGTKDLSFGGYYGFGSNTYQNGITYFDSIRVFSQALTLDELAETITGNTVVIPAPSVSIDYSNGTVTNNGSDSTAVVGAYTMDALNNATEFKTADSVVYTNGRDGASNSAISTNHKTGAYTVVKNYGFGTNDFTVSTWFKMANTSLQDGGKDYLFGIDNPDTTSGFALSLRKNSKGIQYRFKLCSNGQDSVTLLSSADDKWHNLVLTREGTVVTIYFDGVVVKTYTVAANYDFGTADLAFGAHLKWGYEYNNIDLYYDDVKVWNKALTSTEVSSVYSE